MYHLKNVAAFQYKAKVFRSQFFEYIYRLFEGRGFLER